MATSTVEMRASTTPGATNGAATTNGATNGAATTAAEAMEKEFKENLNQHLM